MGPARRSSVIAALHFTSRDGSVRRPPPRRSRRSMRRPNLWPGPWTGMVEHGAFLGEGPGLATGEAGAIKRRNSPGERMRARGASRRTNSQPDERHALNDALDRRTFPSALFLSLGALLIACSPAEKGPTGARSAADVVHDASSSRRRAVVRSPPVSTSGLPEVPAQQSLGPFSLREKGK